MMIIQSILFFVLGVVVAAFVLALLAPVLWRRAMFLARKVLHSEMPLSLMEVEADRDFLRVQHALAISRVEQKLQAEQAAHVQRRVELNRMQEKFHDLASLEPLYEDLGRRLDEYEEVIEKLQYELEHHGEKVKSLSALEPHNTRLQKQIEEQERKIARLESQNAKLTERLKTNGKVDKKVVKTFRNEIKNIAATVVAGVVKDEGKSSLVGKLTAKDKSTNSLAAAIRRKVQKKKRK